MDPACSPKRRRVGDPGAVCVERPGTKFPEVMLFVRESKMGSSRRAMISALARDKGFGVADSFSTSVTHVVAERNQPKDVWSWLKNVSAKCGLEVLPEVLDISWLTDCMESGCRLPVEDRHRLKEESEEEVCTRSSSIPIYACQRKTPVNHLNHHFTDALEDLAEGAAFSESNGRALAFRRAASVLKSLPFRVARMEQLQGVPCLGKHSLGIIQELLDLGVCKEVEKIRSSEMNRVMKVFMTVWGVGLKTAARWYRDGLRSLSEVRASPSVKLTRMQQAGFEYHTDLARPVSHVEADTIAGAIRALVPNSFIAITGGFRRGKDVGHDVDLLLTHPDEGGEVGLLCKLLQYLDEQDYRDNTYKGTNAAGLNESKSTMDHFERCFTILRLPLCPRVTSREDDKVTGRHEVNEAATSHYTTHPKKKIPETRERAVRVDFVVCPSSQYAFALLGWTGSQQFERDLRRYASQEKAMSLSSHHLFDKQQNTFLRANTEEEIFAHLGLPYLEPSFRNA
uniref:DNA-directed DNA/RNA polymerase mu isoform X2 n=1 Tax=Myxine glutinosa TaxID=7769 RepID=UPI00358E9484